MDLSIVLASSTPSMSTKMLLHPPRRNSSSFLANKKFRVPPTTQCNINASNKVSDNNSQAIVRRSENFFQPSIWHYDYIQSLSSEYKGDVYVEKSQMLREEVRMMLFKVENSVDQLELIDVLQRLGVAYHFNNEIRNMLDNIYNMMDNSKKDKNLYATALGFRLLRQHGYDVSTDMFLSFQDEMGNFSQHSSIDVEGMLSLYEASFLSFENETILDEAKDFTSKYLKEYLSKNNDENNDHHDHYLSLLINQALEIPLHWRIPRWEAQWFINAYEQKKNMNPLLLQLAKLDFNILQTIYQEELKVSSRWWKNTGLGDKLSFARDRMVENYIWTVGDIFEPQFANLRTVITKVNALITTIDDVYDVYGTFEELKLFTDVIERWDPFTIDNLPYYMKLCFLALYNFVNELAYEIFKDHGYNVTPYLQKSWIDLCKSYFIEKKWNHSGYNPSFEEYIENAWVSIGASVILVHTYVLIPQSFREDELLQYSEVIKYSSMILRLANDQGTYERENETGDFIKSIQCLMNENETSETDAHERIKSMLNIVWKKMNKEAHDSPLSKRFKEIAMNLGRMALCMYQHGDGHSIQYSQIKNRILSLLIQPIQDNIYV
ncbi:hypothetical protein HN51_055814 [Arachis hypogaea]|uniref:Myrcene synthase n=1 Tax=Arachis hypogaea TaxID=3818 RepID=A0A444XRE0_ARAHY|nr:terpene synthase 10 isoform X1 [Arachis hypogaea]QHN78593.1 Myrcene synthase [Arachis hypogaea]RYQ92317.1 hypothetical protein Ahy_B09g098516 [Arachis hypogaea]